MAGRVPLLGGLLLLLVLPAGRPSVFLSAPRASAALGRWRRAGSYLLEELLEGNLERECYEEICVHEEAREVFENDALTDEFWRQYRGGSPCASGPCLNNGSCQDHIRTYTCTCAPGYEGQNCAVAANECHAERADACQHFCHPGQASYVCSCAQGHQLGPDHKACIPKGNRRPASSSPVTPDFSPKVKLTNSKGQDFCGGVLIQEGFVLTTAKCSLRHRNVSVKVGGDRSKEPQMIRIKHAHVHLWYEEELGQNDVSLLELERPVQCPAWEHPVCIPERDFAEQVLIPRAKGLLSGWTLHGTNLGTVPAALPVTQVGAEECGRALNVTVTTRTSCEGGGAAPGQWLEGSTVTREHRGTWFLTGILGSPAPSPPAGQGHSFLVTTVPRYSLWIRQTMKGGRRGQTEGIKHEVPAQTLDATTGREGHDKAAVRPHL
ncbi:vitamin K-dependent protein Z [Perognathus longimembris pacificus]|uniref:vitamin K-dependent protein Z n=1 Tax=Perognathus longimembris pacificus TaxID=214514 RepID=UPI00201947E9|nr:vitamin K-dependent protein Z [Perognathus longimembris pacificus]